MHTDARPTSRSTPQAERLAGCLEAPAAALLELGAAADGLRAAALRRRPAGLSLRLLLGPLLYRAVDERGRPFAEVSACGGGCVWARGQP